MAFRHSGTAQPVPAPVGSETDPPALPEEDRALRRASDDPQRHRGTGLLSRPRRGRRLSLWVDALLLLLIAALVAAGWFGYQALRDLYAPVWERRAVVFVVEAPDLLVERPAELVGGDLRSAVTIDADRLGRVVQAEWSAAPDGAEGRAGPLLLTVEADARYREGQGYFMGSTRLLAGSEGVYRLRGRSFQGRIVSLGEK